MLEIETGVLREIVKDQAAVGRHSIAVPVLLRRLHVDEPVGQARDYLREALERLESDELWTALRSTRSERELRRLVGALADAEMELSALIEEDGA